jgi:putative phage-type endonuclease
MIDKDLTFDEFRATGIGGSDVASILGLSPYKTPLDVYLSKIGLSEPLVDNAPMLWGRMLERVIIEHYANVTGEKLTAGLLRFRHNKHHFMIANLDGLTESGRVVEVKTARTPDGWGEPGTDEIPIHYLTQVHHYLSVTGLEVADVPVLISGSDSRIYTIYRDFEIENKIIENEYEFWQKVVNRVPPLPANDSDIIKLFPSSIKSGIEATPEILTTIGLLANYKSQIKELEILELQYQTALKFYMQDHDGITMDGKPLVTWKSAKDSKKTDWQAVGEYFLSEYSDIARGIIENNTKINPGSRRFLLK